MYPPILKIHKKLTGFFKKVINLAFNIFPKFLHSIKYHAPIPRILRPIHDKRT